MPSCAAKEEEDDEEAEGVEEEERATGQIKKEAGGALRGGLLRSQTPCGRLSWVWGLGFGV